MENRWTREEIKLKGRLLIVLLAISIMFNFMFYIEHKHEINQKREHNERDLETISTIGENLATRLDQFLNDMNGSEDHDQEELHLLLTDSWRVVLGESVNTRDYLARISPHHMESLESKWSLLQLSLFRTSDFLRHLNTKFLEQGTYDITDEEIEQLKAVVEVYRKIYEEVESESVNPVLVIDELTEPMMLIDPSYALVLDRLEQN